MVEEPAPEGPGFLSQGGGVFILQEEQTPAVGAGVEEFGNRAYSAPHETAVDQIPWGRG